MPACKPLDVTALTDTELSARLVGLTLARRKVCLELGPQLQRAMVLQGQLQTLDVLILKAKAEVELRRGRGQ